MKTGAAKLEFKTGDYVVVRMKDHCRLNQVGEVLIVLRNPPHMGDAVLVKLHGMDDWFYGISSNIQHANYG